MVLEVGLLFINPVVSDESSIKLSQQFTSSRVSQKGRKPTFIEPILC